MSLPKVTIQIVSWNSLKHLPACLQSIFAQSYRDFQVLVIDNNSQDGTMDFIRNNYPEVTIFPNKKNLGFAKANNQGIRLLHSPYVLFCNPDVVLSADWLEKIMAAAESPDYVAYGSFGGQLLKLKLVEGEIGPESKTAIIDSGGLRLRPNRRVVEIGAGQPSGQIRQNQKVFGHSGALVLYRRQTLDDCLVKTKYSVTGEYFDEDFFSYKEDVDLAWRAQLLGWPALLVAAALAYHVRSTAGSEHATVKAIIANRRRQAAAAKYYSYRNHLLLLLKNEFLGNFFRDFWRIKWLEIRKAGYLLIFEPKNISAWGEIIKLAPKIMAKRRIIFARAKIGPRKIREFIK